MIAAAHAVGFRTHSHHHVRPRRIIHAHWARHLLRDPRPAAATPAASPNSCRCRSCTWRRRCSARVWRARARRLREALLMHAVARLALNPIIHNIQTSWVKMGTDGARACLARRRQRPRRHPDERNDHARRGRRQRSRAGTQAYRSRGRRGWPPGAPANDVLWRPMARRGRELRLVADRLTDAMNRWRAVGHRALRAHPAACRGRRSRPRAGTPHAHRASRAP